VQHCQEKALSGQVREAETICEQWINLAGKYLRHSLNQRKSPALIGWSRRIPAAWYSAKADDVRTAGLYVLVLNGISGARSYFWC
jgi:hypothetical protein